MAKKEEKQPTLEELHEQLSNELDKLVMGNDDIEMAMIALKFKGEEDPRVWRKGHFYDVAKLLNSILNAYRTKASVDLGL